jgi:glycosyltransferase involved in cell wall biosynthesis
MKANKHDLVSVIIPVYNCESYLEEAIKSVLSQTYRPVETVVIDDGSTDSSTEIAKSFVPHVQYYYQPNSGLGAARNLGVKKARGTYVAFLDADDIWLKDKLASQMAAIKSDPEIDMIFGHVRQFLSTEAEDRIRDEESLNTEIMSGYVAGTMLIKKEAFLRVGPFATDWRVGEFIDWYLKAKEHGLKNFLIPAVVMKRRVHDKNMGIRERKHQKDYVRILKTSLDRRRAADKEKPVK